MTSLSNDPFVSLKLLDDQFRKNCGRFAGSPKELYQYSSKFPEQFPEVNYKQISSYWELLQSLREEPLSEQKKDDVVKATDKSMKNVFCRYFNSPTGCKASNCKFRHMSPACCITMYNVPQHIDSAKFLDEILTVLLDEPEYFCIHPCLARKDCYTIECASTQTQKALMRSLRAHLKESKDLILTTDNPKEAQCQFDTTDKVKKDYSYNPLVVWEWQRDDGTWSAYPSDFVFKLETCKIGEALPFKNAVNGSEYVVVKCTNWQAYQTRPSTNKKRSIRRIIRSEKSNSEKLRGWVGQYDSGRLDYVWEYEENNGSLTPLDVAAMKTIESAKLYEKVSIQSGKYTYQVEKITNDTAWQINLQTSKKRQLFRKNGKSKKIVWEWQDADGVFKPYDSFVSDLIEKLPEMGKVIVVVKSGRYEVMKFSSSTGIQINVVTKTIKKIRQTILP